MADVAAGNSVTERERPQINNPLAKKLNKILESRLENDKVCLYCMYDMSSPCQLGISRNRMPTFRALHSLPVSYFAGNIGSPQRPVNLFHRNQPSCSKEPQK